MSGSDLSQFLAAHTEVIQPLSRETNLAYWTASISGKQSDFDRFTTLQLKIQNIYADTDDFEKIRKWRDDPRVSNPVERRQVELLYADYLRNQIDPALNEEITRLGSKLENQFTTHRATLDGQTVTSNQILEVMRESNDPDQKRRAWEAGKEVGPIVCDDLRKLVKLRNEAAESLGYDTFYTMSLELDEQNETDIVRIFEELDNLTREPFRRLKETIDDRVAERHSVDAASIRPWHYDDLFFQEVPKVFGIDIDRFYRGRDILEIVERYYSGLDLEVGDIIANSSLYEQPGKDQHAFCTDIDRNGDIRVLANIKDDEMWAGTMLHELGHAVYDKYIDPGLPFLLRHQAHIFVTEAIAMMFGRLSKNADWLRGAVGISEDERESVSDELFEHLRISQLIFARWAQVMMNFERFLYKDPDQDLNDLWWGLVEKYQMVTRPDDRESPDWATKTHVVSVPVYYHNYLLGELLASQLTHHMRTELLPPDAGSRFLGHPEVGAYLKEMVFKPGARFRWSKLVERATGERLTAKYFAEEFIS